jgi:hypothetical protein
MKSRESRTVLQSISPADILADEVSICIVIKNWVWLTLLKALWDGYCEFLKRGSLSECCKLLIQCYGAQALYECVQNLLTPPQSTQVVPQLSHPPRVAKDTTPTQITPHEATPHEAAPHEATPHEATPHEATPHPTCDHTEFFKEKFPLAEDIRIQRLVRVARRIAKTEKISYPKDSSTPMDSSALRDSGSNSTIAQATTIYWTIKKSSDRLYPLCFANAVELIMSSLEKGGRKKMSRETRKTIAWNHLQASLDVDKQKVVDLDNEGSSYLTCMEVGGAASLYSIDGARTE